MWFSLWVVICIPLTCIASSSTVTYVDTLIDTFLSKEQLIWDKIDKHLNPLPDIQLIDSHHDTVVPKNYLYEVHNDFKRLISINSIINVFWMKIEAFSWREAKVNTTLTMEEIDEKYNEVLKLSDSFNHTSLADFWDYCVAKMNQIYEEKNYETTHYLIFLTYKQIQLTLLRVYTLLQKFNFLGYYHFQGNYRSESTRQNTEYLKKVLRIRKQAKQYVDPKFRDVYGWKQWLTDDDYHEEITKFLQGYIVNEINLSKDGSCSKQCNDFDKIEQHSCDEDTGCSERRKCNGILRYCRELDDVHVCPTADVYRESKRYTQVKYDDGRIARRTYSCEYEVRMEAFTKWFSKCTNCFCLCDDTSESDRYFSLREVVSNIDDNKVVEGVSLIKHNKMLQLNIEQKKLKPQKETLTEGVFVIEKWKFLGSSFDIEDEGVVEGVDYHTLTQENRSINLDTVVVPDGYVVTGVRFGLVNGHISLQVRGTEFDYLSGRLNKNGSMWFSNANCGSDELILGKKSARVEERVKIVVNDRPNLFVKFGPTDFWSDISQTTVPLIDGEQVFVRENTPLSGVGLYHKSSKGFGGYIAVKLVVLNDIYYIPDN